MVRFAAISDIHEQFPDPCMPADCLLFPGDMFLGFSAEMTRDEYNKHLIRQSEVILPEVIEYFLGLPVDTIIMTAGNHDHLFDFLGLELTNYVLNQKMTAAARKINQNEYPRIIYLENSFCEFKGLKIWGTPFSPLSPNGVYPRTRTFVLSGEDYIEQLNIPDADIILSHATPDLNDDEPPDNLDALDYLESEIKRAGPKVLVSGHYHWMRGKYRIGETDVLVPANTLKHTGPTIQAIKEDPYMYFELEAPIS